MSQGGQKFLSLDKGRARPIYTLAVLATQAAPGLFYPYLRHYFGPRFWDLKLLAFLTALCFGAILTRIYARSLTFMVVERLPGNPHRWTPAYESDNWVGERFILSFLAFWFVAMVFAIGHWIAAWLRSRKPGFPHIKSMHPGYSRLWFLVRLPGLRRVRFLQKYNAAEAFLEPPFLFLLGYLLSFPLPEFGAFVVLASGLLLWGELSVWREFHHMDLQARDSVLSGFEHELRMREAFERIQRGASNRPADPAPPEAACNPRQPRPSRRDGLSREHEAMLDQPEAAEARSRQGPGTRA